jgi:hypothetical protein
MSPRAAAMFRQQMQPEIGQNTKIMQNTQMQLQHDDSLNSLKQNQTTLARDNDRTPYPDQNAYYQQANADGSMNLRPSTDKISDQLRTLQVQIAQKGPVNNAPGAFTPGEVHNLTTSTLSEHSDSWMRSAVTDVLENDTPRDKKNKISTTAVQQVLNLRDIVEGKDPQSQQALQKNMPTVNSTLNAAQIDKWRDQLNGMLDGAKKIDRSDYDFQLQQMKDFSKSGKLDTPDKLFGSPQFQYLVHAADPLGLTPEEQLKNFSDIFTNAAGSSYGGASFDLSSDASKRTQIMNKIDAYAKAWPQYGQMLGAKFTGTMADALKSEVTKGALSKLEEDSKQYREDPAKYAAGVSSGYQDPTGKISYRSPMMKGVEDQLFQDPSMFAMVKPMSNGKTVISNAVQTMSRIGAQGFGQGFEPTYLSKDAYQSQANKITSSGNPEQVDKFFQQLNKVAPHSAATIMDQLTKVGNLDPRYQIAQNLPTSQARIAAYSDIMSKGAAIEAYTKSEGGETAGEVWKKATKANQDQIDFVNRLYGADSPEASKAVKMLNQTWASAYSANMGVKGTSQSDAATAAQERVSAQIPPVSQVGEQHSFLGMHWGTSGPQSKVQFSRPDFSTDQQEAIRGNLLKAQQEQEISKYQPVPAPISQGAYNFNGKLDAKWISQHPFIWYPVRQGGPTAAYRLQYQGMNADGSPNSKGYDMKVYGTDGTPRYYEVQESDALKKAGQ